MAKIARKSEASSSCFCSMSPAVNWCTAGDGDEVSVAVNDTLADAVVEVDSVAEADSDNDTVIDFDSDSVGVMVASCDMDTVALSDSDDVSDKVGVTVWVTESKSASVAAELPPSPSFPNDGLAEMETVPDTLSLTVSESL
jgi:hypothetical protein